jgi:hypothetical protein
VIASVVGLVLVGSLLVLVTGGSGGGAEPDQFDGVIDRGLKVRTGKELEKYLLDADELMAGLSVNPGTVESEGTFTEEESEIPALAPCQGDESESPAPESESASPSYPVAQATFSRGTEFPRFTELLMVFPKKTAVSFMKEYESQYSKCKEYQGEDGQRLSMTVEGADFGDHSLRLKIRNLSFDPSDPSTGSDAESLLVRVGGTLIFMTGNSAGAPVQSDLLEKLVSKAVGKVVKGD